MLDTIRVFGGLPHRCQAVAEQAGVHYINDSKATNLGATQAAVAGLANGCNLILIAGGQGKGQDFSPLGACLKGKVRLAILMGEAASQLADAIDDAAEVVFATSMASAVSAAKKAACAGDIVLLSPACASFDMFNGFEDRGNQFVTAVRAQV